MERKNSTSKCTMRKAVKSAPVARSLSPVPDIDWEVVAERKTACGYQVQYSCANCAHVIHYYSLCRKHRFPVNRDKGMCADFALIGSRTRQSASLPGGTASVPSARRKTITKRTK